MLVLGQPAFALPENWDRCLASVYVWEGGWTGYRPQEPGGYAMRGLSLETFRRYEKEHGRKEPTWQDLRDISLEKTSEIYREKFGSVIDFDARPAGYDCASLHIAIMQGTGQGTPERPGWAALNEKAGGDFGKLIILAMRAKMHREDCGPTINSETGKRTWFCRGWAERFVAIYDIARDMAK